MANFLAQPRAEHCRHGPVRCSNYRFRSALCLRHRPARPQRPGLDQVTANPTAEWVARQITEAFPWDEAPHYLIRDRDRIYGSVVTRRLRAMASGTSLPHHFALAEWLCRTADRIDSTRVSGSCGDLGRGPFASDTEILCWLLQRD